MPPRTRETPPTLPRRSVLQGLGTLAVGAVAPACGGTDQPATGIGGAGGVGLGPSCTLTPEQAEGPYFIDTGLERRDIAVGRPGVALRLRLTLVNVEACSPIEGALVELWHTDAAGVYSGFDIAQGNLANVAGETFLRGYQRTEADGTVTFNTIYPGWYPGRTPHLHLLALLNDNRLVTTQLYFDDALTDRVYQLDPYAARGDRDTTNGEDRVSRFNGAAGPGPLLLDVVEDVDGYFGSFTIGVAG